MTNWSEEQEKIFQWFAIGNGNLVIKARAGTGKTTTIKAAFEFAPENGNILYAVFNKRNQKEAEAKITDPRVQVSTLHSLGYKFIKRIWPSAKPDDNVEFARIEQVAPMLSRDDSASMAKLIGFIKNTTVKPTIKDIEEIAETYDITFADNFAHFAECAMMVLELSKQKDVQNRISFNDMVWLPVANNWVCKWFHLVVIDEAQDMNKPQLIMARDSVRDGGRCVVVGDDRQAIYGFRGAAQNGMGMMKITLRAEELGLTTTYRCPKKVVELASQIVPDYRAADEAPEGKVESASEESMLSSAVPGCAILSRLNAPLMPTALKFLRKNVPVRIEGRDIGRQLMSMVKSQNASNIRHLIGKLELWHKKQVVRLSHHKNSDKKIEQATDILETLKSLCEDCDNMAQLEARLNNLFQDTDSNSKPAVVLSTVHKAKGLEWPKVFILSYTFRRGKGIEEDNIYYVAITRAQKALYLVGSEIGETDKKTNEINVIEDREPMVLAAKNEDENGLILIGLGMVFDINGTEHICTAVDDECAVIRCGCKAEDRTLLLGNKTKAFRVLRTMDEDWIEQFLAGEVRLGQIKQTSDTN